MTREIVIGSALVVAAATGLAQEQVMTPERRLAVEGELTRQPARAPVLDVRVTPGRPYTGDAITEFVQVLPDGNRITRRTVTRTFRDNEGRTRREQTGPGPGGRERVQITIVDPVAHTSFVLEPDTRTAWRQAAATVALAAKVAAASPGERGGGRGGAWVPAPGATPDRVEAERRASIALAENARGMSGQLKAATERAVAGEGTSTRQDLGTQMVEGIAAEGTRTTTVIAAGSIGNEQPITIVSEQWFSLDLQVFVMTKHSDPRSGETAYRLANIVRGEPDPTLFEVPADYTVKEGGFRRMPLMRER
jgi:hypothetical protein